MEEEEEVKDFSSNRIGLHGLIQIHEKLKLNYFLKYLYLPLQDLGDQGAMIVADILKSSSCLLVLNLSSNRICFKGAIAIAEALSENQKLALLNIDNNNIQDQGCKVILESLQKNKTLKWLNMNFNEINNIVTPIPPNLQSLFLCQNKLICFPFFLENLRVLDISWNKLHAEGIKDLCMNLRNNYSILELNIKNNTQNAKLSPHSIDISKLIERNLLIHKHWVQKMILFIPIFDSFHHHLFRIIFASSVILIPRSKPAPLFPSTFMKNHRLVTKKRANSTFNF